MGLVRRLVATGAPHYPMGSDSGGPRPPPPRPAGSTDRGPVSVVADVQKWSSDRTVSNNIAMSVRQ